MQVLLISGEDNSGKSTLIHSIATWLKRRDYKPKDVNPNGFWKFYEVANGDVQTLFEKNDVCVYVHSATDNEYRINELKYNVEKIGVEKIDILITSVRNHGDKMRNLLCDKMEWKESNCQLHDKNGNLIREIPLVRIKYFSDKDKEKMKEWYQTNLLPIAQTYLETFYEL